MKKPVIMLIKHGTLAVPEGLRPYKHHPEMVAIQNLIQSTRKDYEFVFVGAGGNDTQYFQKDGFHDYDLKTGSFLTTLAYLARLMLLLFKYRPKRVITFNDWIFPASIYCLLAREARYTPFFVTSFHYWGQSRLGRVTHILLWNLNWAFLQFSTFKLKGAYALSHYTFDGVVRNVPRLRNIIQVISYPISPIFKPSNRKPEEVIMVNAAMSERKGLHWLIRAMPLMNKKVRLIIKTYDKPREIQSLKQLAAELKVENNIIWNIGTLDDMELADLYRRAKLFVFPTLEDALGVVVLEALHCGLPVVGTNNSGVTDMIVDGKNGLLVPPMNPVKLAEAVNLLLNDDELYGTLAGNTVKVLRDCYYRNRLTLEQALSFAS